MGGRHDQSSGPLASNAADSLSDVLEVVRLTGALFFLVDAAPPWIAEAPASAALAPVILPRAQHVVSYHVIVEGSCWCAIEGEAPVRLHAGDVIVVPHGDAYALSTERGARSGATLEQLLDWFHQMASGQLPVVVKEGGDGAERLNIICGFLGCDALPFNPILATLPRLLHVKSPKGADDGLTALIEFARGECRNAKSGRRSVLLRLGELMFVEVVRRHLASLESDAGGWLAGLRDPLVGRALARLHERPNRPWTLDALARELATSRSVLSQRFAHFVGEPPMHYLTRWRMQVAAGRLADETAKVAAVARDVGYDSEAAFSRAFKKATGIAPTAWRKLPRPDLRAK
jgi:AraC-like DNA-binding protein